jgi:hypothetical protein
MLAFVAVYRGIRHVLAQATKAPFTEQRVSDEGDEQTKERRWVPAPLATMRFARRLSHPLVLALFFLVGVTISCTNMTGPEIVPDWIKTEWSVTQEQLSAPEWVGSRAWSVQPESTKFTSHPGPFMCNGTMANGCFSTKEGIEYNERKRQVVRHEAGHAILYRLGDPRWRCVGHTADCVNQPH